MKSPSFREALRRTRLAFGNSGKITGRNKISQVILDKFYHNLMFSFDYLLFEWTRHEHFTLALDGWENTNNPRSVNFLAMSNGQTIYFWAEFTRDMSTKHRKSCVAGRIGDAPRYYK
jgi:hypothetical protein